MAAPRESPVGIIEYSIQEKLFYWFCGSVNQCIESVVLKPKDDEGEARERRTKIHEERFEYIVLWQR